MDLTHKLVSADEISVKGEHIPIGQVVRGGDKLAGESTPDYIQAIRASQTEMERQS